MLNFQGDVPPEIKISAPENGLKAPKDSFGPTIDIYKGELLVSGKVMMICCLGDMMEYNLTPELAKTTTK